MRAGRVAHLAWGGSLSGSESTDPVLLRRNFVLMTVSMVLLLCLPPLAFTSSEWSVFGLRFGMVELQMYMKIPFIQSFIHSWSHVILVLRPSNCGKLLLSDQALHLSRTSLSLDVTSC